MVSRRIAISICTVCAVMLLSCATVPTHQVWRPWIRTVNNAREIPVGSKIRTEVTGETTPLLGDEGLVALRMKATLDNLLERRGFVVEDGGTNFVLSIVYLTRRVEKLQTSFSSITANRSNILYSSSVGSGATSGLGVAIARAVGYASMMSINKSMLTSKTRVEYSHTVSAELRGSDQSLWWKGESTWDSPELDITSDILPALQLLMSDLPASERSFPHVPEVRASHAANYFRLECEGRWFTCPALPYRIRFESPSWDFKKTWDIPNAEDHEAMAAYVDLIQTAEYALPVGDDEYEDPLRSDLWRKVQLGGLYTLGPSKQTVYVLIDLSGKSSGYLIKKCRIPTPEEWAEYVTKMDEWRLALKEFYDYFEE